MNLIGACERGLVPDRFIRAGIRGLLRRRLDRESGGHATEAFARGRAMVHQLREGPIAEQTDRANEQHYEMPPGFFRHVLGRHLKYSSALWHTGTNSLDEAEVEMLRLTCERARLEDGQRILELGCGWGSLTLWMAQHYPSSRIVALSNSRLQREHIEAAARERGLTNIEVITADINEFHTDRRFDRVVSVEMFEHMRNYRELMRRIAGWLDNGGRLFVHVFCHRELAYPFEEEGQFDWMARHFFSGGIMPGTGTLLHFQDDLALDDAWICDGRHYQRTAEAWLENLDANRNATLEILARIHGARHAEQWFQRWRMFFMACAELFGYRAGQEWMVAHYRFKKRGGDGK